MKNTKHLPDNWILNDKEGPLARTHKNALTILRILLSCDIDVCYKFIFKLASMMPLSANQINTILRLTDERSTQLLFQPLCKENASEIMWTTEVYAPLLKLMEFKGITKAYQSVSPLLVV